MSSLKMTKACANERRELTFLIVLCVQITVVLSQGKPIYNIAHMVNTISEVKKYLDKGANGIETDVTFLRNGTARWAHHGFPCDCFRNCDQYQDIVEHLRYIHLITTSESSSYNKQLTLLFLDLKVSDLPENKKIVAGNDIAKKLIENIWQKETPSPINVILSIGHTNDSDVIRGALEALKNENATHLLDKIGWDVGLGDSLDEIETMYKNLSITSNRWQGDGATNCVNPLTSLTRLSSAVENRNNENGYIDKVYRWTVDLSTSIRTVLSYDVDAIMTNHPERVKNILDEVQFRGRFRMALQSDNPWERKPVENTSLLIRAPPLIRFISVVYETASSLVEFIRGGTRARAISGITENVVSIVNVLIDSLENNISSYTFI